MSMELTLTKNFYEIIRLIVLPSSQDVGTSFSDYTNGSSASSGTNPTQGLKTFSPITAIDGSSTRGIACGSGSSSYWYMDGAWLNLQSFTHDNAPSSSYRTYTFFKVGSGNTVPTIEDYKLDNEITSDISINLSCSKIYENNIGKLLFTLVITNTGSSDLSVSEVSLNKQLSVLGSGNKTFMLGRCVLEQPLVIPQGESRSLQVSFGF